MIAPDVSITDLEPDATAHLYALIAGRPRERQLQVLHDGGRVVRAVHTDRGAVEVASLDAQELLGSFDADRVVLLDRRLLDGLAADIDELAVPQRTQPELLWLANERFWTHPAVATEPAPPASPWPGIAARLRALGDDYRAVVAAWRGDELYWSVVAEVRLGAIVSMTSVRGERPRRPDARRVAGDARLALLCDWSDVEEIVAAPDVPGVIRRHLDEGRYLFERGIREALWG